MPDPMPGTRRRLLAWRASLCVATAAAVCAPSAQAGTAHTVAAGESLSSIAAVDGVSLDALAAVNGLAPGAELLAGSTVVIPDQGGGTPGSTAPGTGGGGAGAYVVRPGDTLSAIAADAGLSTGQLADANGVPVDAPLVTGTTLTLAGGGGGGPTSSSPGTGGGPVPTPDVVTGDQIAGQAARQNVGPNIAKAVAWQESGWDNSQVSSADARGVMQITPETWDFIQNKLADGSLDPYSPLDNVRAGTTYLSYMLDQTGNDPASALGGYYQGLGSLRSDGLLPESRRYVDSVLTLRDRFAAG
jgi:LysM repeat protein